MRYKLRIFFLVIVPLLVSPALAQDFTYKDYAKASEVWRRGFVFGISQYMSAVAQPDEESLVSGTPMFAPSKGRLIRCTVDASRYD